MRVCCCGPKEESCCPPIEKKDISQVTFLVMAILLIGGAPLAHFLGVGTIGVMAIGISGGFVLFCVTIATVVSACSEKELIDLPSTSSEQMEFYNACRDGNLDEVKRLLKAGSVSPVEPNPSEEGFTPFQIACKNDQRKVIEFLLKKKKVRKKLNDKDPSGSTPTHWAAKNGATVLFGDLALKHKVDITIPDSDGNTASDLIIKKPLPEKKDLEKKSADSTRSERASVNLPLAASKQIEFYNACKDGNLDEVKRLLKAGGVSPVEPNSNEEGFTPFQIACKNDRRDVIEFLLEKKKVKKKINEKDPSGLTPTHWAAKNGNTRLFHDLVGVHHVDETILDSEGNTVLDLIVKKSLPKKKDPS